MHLPTSPISMATKLSVLLLIIITSIIPQPSAGLTFNFTTFTNDNQNITYEEAFPADNAIQLTKNLLGSDLKFSFGRATYRSPLPLWDPVSRNLTDFHTHFTFSIFSQFQTGYGDGLAFFLAPKGSKLPTNLTEGGSMGLTRDLQQLNTTENQFVAVEFDIFKNPWDPDGKHVGIDLDSMASVRNITWGGDIMNGRKSDAWIQYDSSAFNLSVVVTGFVGDVMLNQSLSQIVDLRDYLPEEVIFGFSGSTGNQSAIHKVHTWEFKSTLEFPGGKYTGSRKSRAPLFIGSTGLAVGLVVLVSFLILYRKKIFGCRNAKYGGHGSGRGRGDVHDDEQHKLDRQIMDEVLADGAEGGLRKFTFQELARATNNFDDEGNKLGEGGFGGVYRGYLKDKKDEVAVKRVSKKSRQGIREFAAEVKIISRLRHRNLVRLIGWCHEKDELLLVYEFLTNGSLDFHLFKQKDVNLLLNWETRYKIAKGLASGLLYLHEEWEQCVVHRDIKSSNVMLDSNFGAKLGDFGLARLVDHDKGSQTTMLAGTIGYVAPESAMTGKANKETDIYSFGVVALEIATGRKPSVMVKLDGNQCFVHLVKWVWDLFSAGTMLEEGPEFGLSGKFAEEEMERLMIIGLCCCHPDPKLRPSIRQALQVLNFEAPLPVLPMNMPVATFISAPFSSMDATTSTTSSSGVGITRSIDITNTMAR